MIFGDAAAHDVRCRVCGSFLYSVVRDGAFVHVAMGTLRDDPTLHPTAHIFLRRLQGAMAHDQRRPAPV